MQRKKSGKKTNRKGNSRLHFEVNKNLLKCKRSQLTIFVILAVVIIASIILVFSLTKSSVIPKISAQNEEYLDSAVVPRPSIISIVN